MRSELTLDEACELIVDCPHKTAPEEHPGFAYAVGTKAIGSAGEIDFAKARSVSKDTYDVWVSRAVPQPGDLILCREAPVGPVARVPTAPIVCLGQRTVLLRPNQTMADPRYLFYLLRAESTQARLRALSEGSTVAHLNVSDVRAFPISLPALGEQQRVAAVLGALDAKIEHADLLSKRLAKVPEMLFADAFGHAAGDTPLSEVVNVVRGRSYKSAELAPSEVALVTLKSFHRGGGYTARGLKPYVGPYKPEQEVSRGDLIVAQTDLTQAADVIGRPALVPDRGGYDTLVTSLDVAIVRPASGAVTVLWLHELMRTARFVLNAKAHANGSTVLHLPKGALLEYTIQTPTAGALSGFEQVARPVYERIAAAGAESGRLRTIRDGLLPKLIGGTLLVAEDFNADMTTFAEEPGAFR